MSKPYRKRKEQEEAVRPPLLNVPVDANGMRYTSQIVCPIDGYRYYRNGLKCKKCGQCLVVEDVEGVDLKPAQLEERGFFQFSKPIRKREDLSKWIEHFERNGIQTVIRETKQGFTLWREGEESKEERAL